MKIEKSAIIDNMTANVMGSITGEGSPMNENSKPILDAIAKRSTIRIAGPCALQSMEQAIAIAAEIKDAADLMRAPHHKPRTRPFSEAGQRLYNGIGFGTGKSNAEVAFPIYEEIMKSGLPVATEIMEPSDIARLKDVIRLAWIGSRTSVGTLIETISEQALAAGLPIMVKNPLVDHLQTHIGMIEAAIAGSQGKVPVLACIRGICPTTTEEESKYRNRPNLDYVTKLRAAFPDLPIIVDPSHMVHKNDPNPVLTVTDILTEAMARGASGHIVEVTNPDFPSITDPGIPVHAYLEMLNKNATL